MLCAEMVGEEDTRTGQMGTKHVMYTTYCKYVLSRYGIHDAGVIGVAGG